MNLCNEVVKHKKFGVGTIVESENDYIIVLFDETQEQKKFLYPEAIGAFLELQNKTSSNNEEQIVEQVDTGDESELEHTRIKDMKKAIKREKSIKAIIGIREDEKNK